VADDPAASDQDGPDAGFPPSPEETIVLLRRIQSGDDEALDTLLVKMLPRLRRWAHGRLPNAARGLLETGDIVQTVAAKALKQLAHLDVRQQGCVGFYLRQAVLNEIATHWRRAGRKPLETTLGESIAADDASPLDRLLGAERLSLYESALSALEPADRDAIVGRFELAYNYDELAHYLGKASAATARVTVHRAVKRLAEQLALDAGRGPGVDSQ
jgi:RNA polymerase sigma-70 factor (ECF subfamily)